MKCTCNTDFPEEWNYCPVCGGSNPEKSLSAMVFCDKCGRPVHVNDNYCWFCREPNRFKLAKILIKLAGKLEMDHDFKRGRE